LFISSCHNGPIWRFRTYKRNLYQPLHRWPVTSSDQNINGKSNVLIRLNCTCQQAGTNCFDTVQNLTTFRVRYVWRFYVDLDQIKRWRRIFCFFVEVFSLYSNDMQCYHAKHGAFFTGSMFYFYFSSQTMLRSQSYSIKSFKKNAIYDHDHYHTIDWLLYIYQRKYRN